MGWTQEEDRRLDALRAAGLTRKEIAAEMGKTEGQVEGRVRALRLPLGCDAGAARRGGSPEDAAAVKRRLDAAEVVLLREEMLAALDLRPRGTRYEARLAALHAEAGAVLGEARAEERERHDGKG